MRPADKDMIVFTREDAKELEEYMVRNRIKSLKQFAYLSRVPYQTLLTNMRLAYAKQKVRMQRVNYDRVKLQTRRELCADLVNDGIIKLRQRLALEIFKAQQVSPDRCYGLLEVCDWLDQYLGEENAEDGKSNSRATSQNEGVHQSEEQCLEKEAQEKLDTSECGSSAL